MECVISIISFIHSMIQLRSLKSFFALREENSSEGFMNVLVFLGQPIVAVGLGLIIAILTLGRSLDRHEALTEMEKGMASAGIIMLVTGGVLGQIKPSFVCRRM